MNNYLRIPRTELKLTDGNVVILHRLPNTKWIVHYGWFTYNYENMNGWYFKSIPEGTVIPCTQTDLENLTVLTDNRTGDNMQMPPAPLMPPAPPVPAPPPQQPPIVETHPYEPEGRPCDRLYSKPEKYYGGFFYKEGHLVYLVPGEVYQAACDFRASDRKHSVEANLKADVQSGKLYSVATATAEYKEIEKQIADAVENLEALIEETNAETVSELTEKIQNVETQMDELVDSVSQKLESELKEQNTRVTENTDSINAILDDIENRLLPRITTNMNNIVTLNEGLEGIKEEVEKLGELLGLQDVVTHIEIKDTKLIITKYNIVEGTQTTEEVDLPLGDYVTKTELDEKLDEFYSAVIETALSKIEDEITEVEEKVDGVRTDFDNLKPWVTTNTENIAKINSTVEEQAAEIADLQEKIGRINTWMELDENKTGDKE